MKKAWVTIATLLEMTISLAAGDRFPRERIEGWNIAVPLSFSVLRQQQADERSRRKKRERAGEMSCGSDHQNWPGLQ
jgi:hypothetical protein